MRNNHFAFGGSSKMIYLYSCELKKIVRLFRGHIDTIKSINFAENDKILISGSFDGRVKVWDISEDKKPIHTLGGRSSPTVAL